MDYTKYGSLTMAVRKAEEKLADACWKGYEAIGMKMKDGRQEGNG